MNNIWCPIFTSIYLEKKKKRREREGGRYWGNEKIDECVPRMEKSGSAEQSCCHFLRKIRK
jgi:hypothetical protein